MEPVGPEPKPNRPRTIIHCCEFCYFWERQGEWIGMCNHTFWSCVQDSRFRCHYFRLKGEMEWKEKPKPPPESQ